MPQSEAFRIGSITVHWYGIMIMLGVLAASYISYQEAKRRGEDPDHVWNMFPWVLVAGIVGARLGFILAKLSDYTHDPVKILYIWEGGLSIQGSIVGGALAVILYCQRQRIGFLRWADIIAPGLALAQAIGRWGNYFNQEAFGSPTTLPWGIPISPERQIAVAGPNFPADPNLRFHPTFAYEMIWDLINFALLMWLGRQKRLKLLEGDLLWVYLIVYSIGRIAVEEIRVDSAMVGGFKTPQVVALLTILFAWSMLIYRHRPGSNARLAEVRTAGLEGGATMRSANESGSRVRRVRSFNARERANSAPGSEQSMLSGEGTTTSEQGTL